MKALYSRAIRLTESGTAIGRPTRLCCFTVNAVNADCIVNLRDGGSNGPIMWTLEADNAASSPTVCFDVPLNFERDIYAEFSDKGSQSTAYLAVIEP